MGIRGMVYMVSFLSLGRGVGGTGRQGGLVNERERGEGGSYPRSSTFCTCSHHQQLSSSSPTHPHPPSISTLKGEEKKKREKETNNNPEGGYPHIQDSMISKS